MRLTLEDVEVEMEDQDNEDEDQRICSLCKQELNMTKNHHYEPILHTVDICLDNIMSRLIRLEMEIRKGD